MSALSGLTIAAQDSATMLGREVKHTLRFPLLLVSTILSPVVLLLLFVYILGGPIGHGLGNAARGTPYVDFLVPGIRLITASLAGGHRTHLLGSDGTKQVACRARRRILPERGAT